MTYEQFSERLKKLALSKKQFASETGLADGSVTNWKNKGVPSWVEVFLEKYEKALAYESIKDKVLDIEKDTFE